MPLEVYIGASFEEIQSDVEYTFNFFAHMINMLFPRELRIKNYDYQVLYRLKMNCNSTDHDVRSCNTSKIVDVWDGSKDNCLSFTKI